MREMLFLWEEFFVDKRLIVIDGLDGSGKSTQIGLLKARLQAMQVPLRQIKLPDYDDPSSTLVRMYLNGDFGSHPQDVNVYAASSFYAVDRYASYRRHWKDDYLSGTLILADRYTTSNAIHQGVKLPPEQWDDYFDWLFDYEYNKLGLPRPDCVIFLDMPVEISQKLMSARYGGEEAKKDVHEADVQYLENCRKAALYAAKALGWHVIACSENGEPLPVETIHEKIFSVVQKELKL